MLRIPKITPVRVKTDRISQELIDPGSMSYHFPSGVGRRAVYLDERFDYPEQDSDDADAERKRQSAIWQQLDELRGVRFLDRQVENDYPNRDAVWMETLDELGHRHSAEFYERVFSKLFDEKMDVVIIATGVTSLTGDNYHEIGYLR